MSDHIIEWLSPDGTPSPDDGEGSVEETAAHTWATWRAVQKMANHMALQAQANLSAHHRRGNAKIVVTNSPPRYLDAWVSLEDNDPGGRWRNSTGRGKAANIGDRSAMSIEFGWTQTHMMGKRLQHPVHHDGLDILGGVMRAAIARYGGPQ
jgi:hypothetical protein